MQREFSLQKLQSALDFFSEQADKQVNVFRTEVSDLYSIGFTH